MQNEMAIAHEHHHNTDAIDVFGFWLYIMTDCVLFGCLFATFIVLNSSAMQISPLKSHLNLHDILIESLLLLASNFTFCLAALNLYQKKLMKLECWLFLSFILGASFVVMEVTEFFHLAKEGVRWDLNGQVSSFFTLVGTHGLHVTFGLLWILFLIVQIPLLKMNEVAKRRMTYLGLFWNFLDIVWIFVFTIVYLMGAM
jgi:cytochrome o ubiquinol oxidase subunit 3